ncbi:MAG: hypothetical protein R6X25_04215 [Candidatus Krumholzibacteriia bacterium]
MSFACTRVRVWPVVGALLGLLSTGGAMGGAVVGPARAVTIAAAPAAPGPQAVGEPRAADTSGVRLPIPRPGIPSGFDGPTFVERPKLEGVIEADSVMLTRPIVPRMVVHDRDAIAYLFGCCAFAEAAAESIRFVEIYDFGRSGFSSGDLMVCQPSGRSYLLEGLEPQFLAAAATWARADQLEVTRYVRGLGRMDELALEVSTPDSVREATPPDLAPEEETRQALRAIWAGVHEAVAAQYGEAPLQLYFARDDSSAGIEVWGYRPDSLRFRYLDAGDVRHDLLAVSLADSMIRAGASYVDVLVISSSRSDTLLVPLPTP